MALGAESIAQGASIIKGTFCLCNSRFSNHDFRVIPCILEHGGSDSLHRLQGFEREGGAQNHCTDRAYSGPPKAAVRFTAEGGQILIRRVDLCRMSQAVGAGRDRLGSNLPSLCIESALAHGGPDYALPVQ